MFGEITSRNVYLLQIYKHNQLVKMRTFESWHEISNNLTFWQV